MNRYSATAIAAVLALAPAAAMAPTSAGAQGIGIGISVNVAPPVLPIYEQPPIPGPGYLWTPGYWAWGASDYYWVPGVWAAPPAPGLLWTPAWWGWNNGAYAFHAGYWGPTVGFYGGINYGFGYTGIGYGGGYWNGGRFFYNRGYNNFGGVHITNVYNRPVTVINNSRVSFNGGRGGLTARPTAAEDAALHERHIGATPAQQRIAQNAAHTPQARFAVNHGAPPNTSGRTAGSAMASAQSRSGVTGHAAAGAALAHNAAAAHNEAMARTEHPRAYARSQSGVARANGGFASRGAAGFHAGQGEGRFAMSHQARPAYGGAHRFAEARGSSAYRPNFARENGAGRFEARGPMGGGGGRPAMGMGGGGGGRAFAQHAPGGGGGRPGGGGGGGGREPRRG